MGRTHVVLFIGMFALLQGCASTFQAKPENQSNFLEQNASFGIPAEAVVPHVHARTKINWTAIDKIQLKPVIIDDAFASQLSGEQQAALRLVTFSFHDMLSQRLSHDYTLVEQPEPGAMSIEVAITHAEQSWLAPQLLSKVSWQLQALNSMVTYFRGKPAFAGEITIEFKIYDSLTGELLFAGIDRRVGGQNLFNKEAFNSWGDVQNSLEYWTEQSAYHLCAARQASNCSRPKA